ncbi:hypothetical protein [Novosphingobium sp. 9]|uniref:hypothetical protein n=1 Tax=Novosphingobium sp. 9 TaxID=2025349 RepID=UPI0021B4D631|nr:hypothetical protein [Novosphingobium sp. 9]
MLVLACGTGTILYRHVHAHAPAQATMGELGLCALLVLLLVIGSGLLFVGPALWKQVHVPGRWSVEFLEPAVMEPHPTASNVHPLPHPADTIRKYM